MWKELNFMSILWNIIGGIFAGLIATFIFQYISKPKIDITLPSWAKESFCGEITEKGFDPAVVTWHVRVTNREAPRFLRKFLGRNTAYSCRAWVILHNPPGNSGVSSSLAKWLPICKLPGAFSSKEIGLSSPRTVDPYYIDISSGGMAKIAIAKKTKGEAICYAAARWNEGLPPGEYILEVEVGCDGLSPVSKKFLLKNKQGNTVDNVSLEESFDLTPL